MESGLERFDLRHQVFDETNAGHHRMGGNVVDRLLRIKLGALAAGARQDVDQMAADIEQAEFEHCEESGGTGADEDNVGIYIVNHQGLLENSCCAWAAMPGGLAVLPIRLAGTSWRNHRGRSAGNSLRELALACRRPDDQAVNLGCDFDLTREPRIWLHVISKIEHILFLRARLARQGHKSFIDIDMASGAST